MLAGVLRWLNKAADEPRQRKSKHPVKVFKTRVLSTDKCNGIYYQGAREEEQKGLVKCRL